MRFASAFLQEWVWFADDEFKCWCCFPQKQNEAFLLSDEVGGDVQPVADVTNHTNILMNVVWDSDGSQVSDLGAQWASSLEGCFLEKKYLYVTDWSFHTHRSQKNTVNTAILSPGLYRWDWAELLFSACPFSADPLRFPKMVPQSSSTFFCSSDSQKLLSVFSRGRVPGIFQALSDNHVGDGCS